MGCHDEEFTHFVREASPRLLRTAYFVCGDPIEAQDLVQDALVKVYVRWRRLRSGDAHAYARRCLMTGTVDRWRSRRRETVSDSAVASAAPAVQDAEPEDTRALVALLATLPLRERQCVVLRHYVGLSEAQTAESLGCSVGTVKSSCSRGLKRLRKQLSWTEDHHHA